jgi:hypothetical protein
MLPPVLEGTLGCSYNPPVASAAGPIADNAVECECEFTDEPGSQTVLVTASSDDAEQDGVSMDLANTDLDLADKFVGLRFAAAGLPADAIILSAYVQFTADETQGQATVLTIETHPDAASPTFSTTDADITLRVPGAASVQWTVDPWTNNDAGAAQRTPDLKDLIQELVDLPAWSSASPVVLRFSGSGHRTAESFDDHPDQAAELVVTYTTLITTAIPVCVDGATDADRDVNGHLLATVMDAQCTALATTLGGLNDACGLPSGPVCTRVDQRDPNDADIADSFQRGTCDVPCTPDPVDGTCSNYDPVALVDCLQAGTPFETCKQEHATATHAGADDPICVASGSPLAFHAFGQRSLCEVSGTSEIEIGDREPKQDPVTEGKVEYLARPCPGGDCFVHPYFLIDMEPITFAVRWASDPTFGNLGAVGSGLETALLASGEAEFPTDTIEGTGRGRRGSDGLAIAATNSDPLTTGVDWASRSCDLRGTLAVGVGDDGLCEADGTTLCRSDADCAGVGGVCALPAADSDQMSVTVMLLDGDLVNQPPSAAAGAYQTVECTSTAGASFVLDGRGSSDPDGNLALASWRAGTRTGTEIANSLVAEQSLGVGDTASYVLRVIDTLGQLDEATTSVAVVDTTPPVIACNAPATIQPPSAEPGLAFGATASDVCDDAVVATITGFDCFTFTKKGKRISKLESCIVSFAGNTVTIHDVGGYGDHVTWTVEAPDDSGNVGMATCEVVVAK